MILSPLDLAGLATRVRVPNTPPSDVRPPTSDLRLPSRLCHGSSTICHGSAQKPAFQNPNVLTVLAPDHPNISQCLPCCHGFRAQKSPSPLLVTGVTGKTPPA